MYTHRSANFSIRTDPLEIEAKTKISKSIRFKPLSNSYILARNRACLFYVGPAESMELTFTRSGI